MNKRYVLVALSISLTSASFTASAVDFSSCAEIAPLLVYGDQEILGHYWQNCNASVSPTHERGVRAGGSDVTWSSFKTNYLGTGGLTAAQADAVIDAFNKVFSKKGSMNAYSFDNGSSGASASFASPPSSVKVFARDPIFSSGNPQLTLGSAGTLGSVTYPVDGERTGFGTKPDSTSNYVVKYKADTLTALATANALATETAINLAVTQMFAAATAAAALPTGVGGSKLIIGDDTTGGTFATLSISPTTGSWSLSGFPSFMYITAP